MRTSLTVDGLQASKADLKHREDDMLILYVEAQLIVDFIRIHFVVQFRRRAT